MHIQYLTSLLPLSPSHLLFLYAISVFIMREVMGVEGALARQIERE
jgi:hypothetical protein